MPPTIISPGFLFRLQSFPKVTPVKPLYLTNNGEGKQLTIEEETNQPNQLWNIKPPLPGEYDGSVDVIIIPPNKDSDYLAVSQDVVKSPDEVSLIKNLQVWTIKPIPDFDLFEIKSNLNYGPISTDESALLGADISSKKVIIQFASPSRPRPGWKITAIPILEK